MLFLTNLWEGILEIPNFIFAILFRLGWFSVLYWFFILTTLFFYNLDRKANAATNKINLEDEKERERVRNLKRYPKK